MSDLLLPAPILNWINARNWGQHHEQWHAVRQWDRNSPAAQDWMLSQGWQRASRQEGESGNGFEFLVMHRAMLQLLREAFPADAALFSGWPTPPTNPNDAVVPLPNGDTTPFDPNMQTAIARINAPPASLMTDDHFGRYVETSLRPIPGNPFRQSPDPTTGIHNYLHVRFSDSNSPVDMGVPRVNLGNQRFWRLHGWIDAKWSAFRASRGLSDADPDYQQALNAERGHMSGMHGMPMEMMEAAALAAVATLPVVPRSISHPFEMDVDKEFARLSAIIERVETINDLEELLLCALMVEHFTIPLYLCAMWSAKGTGASTKTIRRIIGQIARQEMLHMGIVNNLLIGIGRKPKIIDSVPVYPGFLPGIETNVPISLEKLSIKQIKAFQAIEAPEFPPVPIPMLESVAPTRQGFKTIGELYSVIADGFKYLRDQGKLTALTTTGQLISDQFGAPGKLDAYDTIDSALEALDLIRGQGEGRPESPAQPGPMAGILAHYYQFGQILDGFQYTLQPDGSFKQDPSKPLPFPAPDEIYNMAPVPAQGYPGISDDFDQAYTSVVRLLETAWNGGGGNDALMEAIDAMLLLKAPATTLMNTMRQPPFGPGNFGPSFRFLSAPEQSGDVPAGATGQQGSTRDSTGAGTTAVGVDYARVQKILDDAVNGDSIGAHGPFWRTLDRDGFVAKAVFGRKLLAINPDGSFNPTESNLIRALEGRAPFDGSVLPRMPDGYDPVPQDRIDEIRAWIAAGCPATVAAPAGLETVAGGAPEGAAPNVDLSAGEPHSGEVHNNFWRRLDDWSMNLATPSTTEDVIAFMDMARSDWLAFAHNPAPQAGWNNAISQAEMRATIGRLEQAQRNTVIQAYGLPVAFLSLLDSFEKFGRDDLPDDPLRDDVRHRMDGRSQWFVWGAFADACLRLGAPLPGDFWSAMLRVILAGLINDGLFRNRFPVQGFTRDASGAAAINLHVRSLADNELPDQLIRRFQESHLSGI